MSDAKTCDQCGGEVAVPEPDATTPGVTVDWHCPACGRIVVGFDAAWSRQEGQVTAMLEEALAHLAACETPEAELESWRALGPLVLRQVRELEAWRDDARQLARETASAARESMAGILGLTGGRLAEVAAERDDLRVIERECRKAMEAAAQYADHRRTCEMRGRARSEPRRCTCGLAEALALLGVARELAPE